MRKRIITPSQPHPRPPDGDWLNPERLAQVELTSEDAAYPIDLALLSGEGSGWPPSWAASRWSWAR
jgi:hypothetical protein